LNTTVLPLVSVPPPHSKAEAVYWAAKPGLSSPGRFYFLFFLLRLSDGSRATKWPVHTCIPPCPPGPQQWRIDQGRQPHLRPPQSCVGQTRPRQIDNITRRQGCMRCGAGFCERNAQTPTPQSIFHLALRSKEGSDTTQARKLHGASTFLVSALHTSIVFHACNPRHQFCQPLSVRGSYRTSQTPATLALSAHQNPSC
jgi:hypothetical protein